MDTDEIVKAIVNRLYDTCGVCTHCGKPPHKGGNITLPDMIPTNEMWAAIHIVLNEVENDDYN